MSSPPRTEVAAEAKAPAGPRPRLTLLALLLLWVPIVGNGFYVFYVVSGLTLSGEFFDFWAHEAAAVAGWTTAVVAGYSLVIAGWQWRWGQAAFSRTALLWSSGIHSLLALVLAALVLVLV